MTAPGTIGTLGAVHVMPVGDLRRHARAIGCWCKPSVDNTELRLLIVHNSDDGRELVERHGLQ